MSMITKFMLFPYKKKLKARNNSEAKISSPSLGLVYMDTFLSEKGERGMNSKYQVNLGLVCRFLVF